MSEFSTRMFVEADDPGLVSRQNDVAALIIAHDLRLHILAAAVGRGVHVRAEADHRHFLVGGRRHRAVDVAKVVEVSVLDSKIAELLGKHAAEVFLLFGRGRCFGGGVRLGVDAHVTQEAFENGMLECAGCHTDLNRAAFTPQNLEALLDFNHPGAARGESGWLAAGCLDCIGEDEA